MRFIVYVRTYVYVKEQRLRRDYHYEYHALKKLISFHFISRPFHVDTIKVVVKSHRHRDIDRQRAWAAFNIRKS